VRSEPEPVSWNCRYAVVAPQDDLQPVATRHLPAAVVGTLARRMAGVQPGQLGDSQLAAAERAVIDWLAAAIGGSALPLVRGFTQALGPLSGPSRLVGVAGGAAVPLAALANCLASHALEIDDIYAPGRIHPGAPVVAAALAAADPVCAGGERLLRAIIVGYEVACRVAVDLGPAHCRAWQTTGTAGAMGAAAAAAILHEFDEPQFAAALSLAATLAAGLQSGFRPDGLSKPLYVARGAEAGVLAVLAIGAARHLADGWRGGSDTTGLAGWPACSASLGHRLAVEQVTVKTYPCCGDTFAAIDAAIDLHRRGVRLTDVHTVEVTTYQSALDAARRGNPATPEDRKFSLPFVTLAALRNGVITEDCFADGLGIDDRLAHVSVAADPVFDAAFPDRRGARVVVTTRNGSRQVAEVADRYGSPANPLTDDALEAKYFQYASPVVGNQSAYLLSAVRGLRSGGSVRDLVLADR
jgi:2-methylcitrate dehydratase PrpD